MDLRVLLTDYSMGDRLHSYWRWFHRRERCRSALGRRMLTFLLNRMAHKHGGYIGNGAVFGGEPVLPHGLHGVYISRYAKIGADCWIYQNVTIGEVNRVAPIIGDRCLIGAGAVIVGGVRIGNDVKIGAGAVVNCDVPDHSTVVAPPPRMITREVFQDAP